MFASIKSRSSSKLVTSGQKLGHRAKSAENLVNTLAVTFLKQSSWILLKIFVLMISRSVWNWVTWGQKLDHLAKSAETLVNTLAVTFFKQSSWILLKIFVLMSSIKNLKLGHLGSKTSSPGQISRKLCQHSSGHIFLTNHQESCSKCLSWWFLGQIWNWITWDQILGHGQISGKLLTP